MERIGGESMRKDNNQDTEKRTETLTLHLTKSERELLERLAEREERKPAELARLLLNKKALEEWAKIQIEEHPENAQPFTRPEFLAKW